MQICQPSAQPLASPERGACRSLTAGDARADGAARRIAVGRDGVAILRRYKGIDMRVRVPVEAYRGVILVAVDNAHEVRLVHRDPDLTVTLCRADEAQAADAAWRSWAGFFGLPALVETADARFAEAGVAPQSARQGGLATRGRRPRFLTRRKLGRPERMCMVHRDEREIIAYE